MPAAVLRTSWTGHHLHMVESTMGVDDPPPDPPETGEQIVAQCLDDLRRAEFSILPSAISRIDGQPLVFQPGVRQW